MLIPPRKGYLGDAQLGKKERSAVSVGVRRCLGAGLVLLICTIRHLLYIGGDYSTLVIEILNKCWIRYIMLSITEGIVMVTPLRRSGRRYGATTLITSRQGSSHYA